MSMFVSLILERGAIPESIDGGPSIAKSLASCIDDLDSIARGLGLKPLGDFVVDYSEQVADVLADEDIEDLEQAMNAIGSDGPWFGPEEALMTVRRLMQHLEGDGTLIVLQGLEEELEYARQQESGFHLSFTE